MKRNYTIIMFGLIEILIGLVTFSAVIISFFLGKSAKSPATLIFVLACAAISFILGVGILKRSLASYHFLLFFATVIIFSKLLILTQVIHLNGALETAVSSTMKSIASIIYHGLLIIYFIQPAARKEFGEKRKVLFSLKLPF